MYAFFTGSTPSNEAKRNSKQRLVWNITLQVYEKVYYRHIKEN